MTDRTEQPPGPGPDPMQAPDGYWRQPPPVPGFGAQPAEPDWQALADRHEEQGRRRKRRQLLAGGAALVAVVGVAAGTVALKGHSGGGTATDTPSAVAPAGGGGGADASAVPSASGSAKPSASASASRKPVTTPTVPGKSNLVADHTGENNLTMGPDTAVKQIPGGWVLAAKGTAGSYAQAPAAVVDVTRSFTVSAWVVNDAAAGTRTAISQGDGAVSSFELGREDAGGQKAWAFRVQTGVGAADTAVARAAVPGAAATGTFTLLTGVYDAEQHTLTLYVDGKSAGTAKAPAVVAGAGELQLGRGRHAGAWSAPWTGVIGHVQVYDRALTAAEAARIKSKGGAGFPAVADWLV
ncbi:hypothetical protein GCM10010441_53330 [Kitasatospora paracochleata]|uniref:LamG-like jellyroll fold domain-containing protein n=1 Tax=Kitasatospora paracochleata TaxID=58354 RepID=A0ABT1IUV7_9ACTN|nr:LamG domain-containing protein [Kitasatospora paracochleata]MCP2308922.1 hypothetical protein [Kitasatospora paracochleata]